jgi:hypothetical protein
VSAGVFPDVRFLPPCPSCYVEHSWRFPSLATPLDDGDERKALKRAQGLVAPALRSSGAGGARPLVEVPQCGTISTSAVVARSIQLRLESFAGCYLEIKI